MAKGSGTGGDAFARDLGYLDAFFDKLDAHGATLGGASGARLRTLVGEERRRWSEIRALLSGVDTTSASRPTPKANTESDVAASRPAADSDLQPRASFTVGSLRSMRERGRRD